MAVRETDAPLAARSALRAEFATVWQAANRVVYSTTLTAVSTANTASSATSTPPRYAN
jgi:hypothetical protein